ncbi:hypothetical protein [Geomonas paludis]|uniref:Uncharacterized protein n=1 Tax=Geomonas paludis TaxID=2740185 RepID=A0A6V8N1L2_9BACT|nr:hypothetical protein [Geomonas paludis]GFO66332.1 hypothetical protein GMPD_42510 [Geomonas paludis]
MDFRDQLQFVDLLSHTAILAAAGCRLVMTVEKTLRYFRRIKKMLTEKRRKGDKGAVALKARKKRPVRFNLQSPTQFAPKENLKP